MEFKDYYKIMGVERSATQDDIKRAYRQLARKYHPDVSKEADAEARFKELGEAYEALKDPEKRAAYDRLGANWKGGQEFRPPPDWNEGFEFSGGGFTGGGMGGDGADYSEFFEQLFGRATQSRGASHGPFRGGAGHAHGTDRHAKVLIDLEDAYHGATRMIVLHVPETDAEGHVALREQKLNVTIPRGVRAGQSIRLSGQGTPGIGQGKAGDLYLEIEFRPHPHYRVDQRDVMLDLPLAPWEAALGASVTVPTPNGSVELRIPAGSASGAKLRLKGRGIPAASANGMAGDFYVVLQIVLPPASDEAARAVYSDMAKRFDGFKPRAKLGV
ncbi:MAG: J domain-containing protein [Rugosibacter sp.]|nr:MAG: J domain-containing protein [Rugosibacter sp.]TBR07508.1 MAG: J domain-containing protein [Rugosibacter sp.]